MRPSDGGPDPVSNGGNTWHFKLDGVYAASTSGMTLAQVKALVEPTQPEKVTTAGASFERASQRLAQLAAQLTGHAGRLAAAWGGANAPKVVAQFQQLHETAIGLANTSQGTGAVLSWYGTTILPFYKSQIQNMSDTFGDKLTGFLTGTDPANTAAASQLAKLNTRIVEAYTAMPPAASKNLPPTTGSFGSPGLASGPAAGRSGGGYAVPLPGSSSSGKVTGPPPAGGPVLGGPVIGGHGTLAGIGPPGGPAGGGVGGGGGLGAPAPGGPPVVTGPVIGGPVLSGVRARGEPSGAADQPVAEPAAGEPAAGEGAVAEPVVGEPVISGRTMGLLGADSAFADSGQALADGPVAGGLGAADGQAADASVAGDAAGTEMAGGPGFMPLGGGQAGRDGERGTWLAEDRDVWADAADVTPAVIG